MPPVLELVRDKRASLCSLYPPPHIILYVLFGALRKSPKRCALPSSNIFLSSDILLTSNIFLSSTQPRNSPKAPHAGHQNTHSDCKGDGSQLHLAKVATEYCADNMDHKHQQLNKCLEKTKTGTRKDFGNFLAPLLQMIVYFKANAPWALDSF